MAYDEAKQEVVSLTDRIMSKVGPRTEYWPTYEQAQKVGKQYPRLGCKSIAALITKHEGGYESYAVAYIAADGSVELGEW